MGLFFSNKCVRKFGCTNQKAILLHQHLNNNFIHNKDKVNETFE